jgi:hypothetical protein
MERRLEQAKGFKNKERGRKKKARIIIRIKSGTQNVVKPLSLLLRQPA